VNIGVCRVRLRLAENHSLKGKRQVLRAIKARCHHKFDIAIAETGDHDVWQTATLGITCVSTDRRHANEILSKTVDFIAAGHFDAELLDYNIEIISVF
jgi:uncharacterized protein